MLKKVSTNMVIRFLVDWLTSIPSKIYRKMIDEDRDPKSIFISLIEEAPEWLLNVVNEFEEEIKKLAEELDYKKLVIWIYQYANGWYVEMEDYLLNKKGYNWFNKYVINRVKEWLETGTVKELEEDIKKTLARRGIYVEDSV